MKKVVQSQKGRAFCDLLATTLSELPDEDDRKAKGMQIHRILYTRKCRLKPPEFEFLLTFDDPLDYLIDISKADEHAEIYERKISRALKAAMKNAIK